MSKEEAMEAVEAVAGSMTYFEDISLKSIFFSIIE